MAAGARAVATVFSMIVGELRAQEPRHLARRCATAKVVDGRSRRLHARSSARRSRCSTAAPTRAARRSASSRRRSSPAPARRRSSPRSCGARPRPARSTRPPPRCSPARSSFADADRRRRHDAARAAPTRRAPGDAPPTSSTLARRTGHSRFPVVDDDAATTSSASCTSRRRSPCRASGATAVPVGRPDGRRRRACPRPCASTRCSSQLRAAGPADGRRRRRVRRHRRRRHARGRRRGARRRGRRRARPHAAPASCGCATARCVVPGLLRPDELRDARRPRRPGRTASTRPSAGFVMARARPGARRSATRSTVDRARCCGSSGWTAAGSTGCGRAGAAGRAARRAAVSGGTRAAARRSALLLAATRSSSAPSSPSSPRGAARSSRSPTRGAGARPDDAVGDGARLAACWPAPSSASRSARWASARSPSRRSPHLLEGPFAAARAAARACVHPIAFALGAGRRRLPARRARRDGAEEPRVRRARPGGADARAAAGRRGPRGPARSSSCWTPLTTPAAAAAAGGAARTRSRRRSPREEVALDRRPSRAREGLLDDEEHGLLTGALELAARPAADVMVPLERLVTVPRRRDPEEVERLVARTGFSRFPVVGRAGELVGYLHVKDVLYADDDGLRGCRCRPRRVRALVHGARDEDVEDALVAMQRAGAHLARVRRRRRRDRRRGRSSRTSSRSWSARSATRRSSAGGARHAAEPAPGGGLELGRAGPARSS